MTTSIGNQVKNLYLLSACQSRRMVEFSCPKPYNDYNYVMPHNITILNYVIQHNIFFVLIQEISIVCYVIQHNYRTKFLLQKPKTQYN